MSEPTPLSDLVADDLLLDRLAGRGEPGGEPVAVLLGALAVQADTPLPARTGRRRTGNPHRYLGAFAALVVAASGAGVAAAVSLPDRGPSDAERAQIVQRMEQSVRDGRPSALFHRLGLPSTDGTTAAKGLVLAQAADGSIVLLPASVVAAAGTGASSTGGSGATSGQKRGSVSGGQPAGGVAGGSTSGGGSGGGSGEEGDDPTDAVASDKGDKNVTGPATGKGGKGKTPTGPTPKPVPTGGTTDLTADADASTRTTGGQPSTSGRIAPRSPTEAVSRSLDTTRTSLEEAVTATVETTQDAVADVTP